MFVLLLVFAAGCSNNNESVSLGGESDLKPVELQSVDELNKTVWDDSKKAFEILTKRYNDISSVTDEEHELTEQYFDRYYDSGYVQMENAESLLVHNIYHFEFLQVTSGMGTDDEQKERQNKIQELYMKIEQKFKEYDGNSF